MIDRVSGTHRRGRDRVVTEAPPAALAQGGARDDACPGARGERHQGGAVAPGEIHASVERSAPELPPERGVASVRTVNQCRVRTVCQHRQQRGGSFRDGKRDVRSGGPQRVERRGGQDKVANPFELKGEDAHETRGTMVNRVGGSFGAECSEPTPEPPGSSAPSRYTREQGEATPNQARTGSLRFRRPRFYL